MRNENLRTIGMMLLFVIIAVVIICFDDIRAMLNETMMEQTDSMLNQLFR